MLSGMMGFHCRHSCIKRSMREAVGGEGEDVPCRGPNESVSSVLQEQAGWGPELAPIACVQSRKTPPQCRAPRRGALISTLSVQPPCSGIMCMCHMVALLTVEVKPGKLHIRVFTLNEMGSHRRAPSTGGTWLAYISKGSFQPVSQEDTRDKVDWEIG